MPAALLALTLALSPPPDETRTVETWKQEIVALLEAEHYALAATELEGLYAQAPSWQVLFNWSVASFRAGDCESSAGLSRRLLEDHVNDADPVSLRDAALNLSECERRLSGRTEPPTPSPTPPIKPLENEDSKSQPVVAHHEPAAARPWARDPLGASLVGTGGGVALVGAGLLFGAYVANNAADDLNDHRNFDQSIARAAKMQRAGFVLVGMGSALAIGGVIRWAVVARRRSGRTGQTAAATWSTVRF